MWQGFQQPEEDPQTEFLLSDEAVPGTIEVTVADVRCEGGWVFEQAPDRVVFDPDGECMPQAGESIRVDYELVCLSP